MRDARGPARARRRWRPSAATQAFIAIALAVLLFAIAIGTYLVVDARRDVLREAEAKTTALSAAVAGLPVVVEALGEACAGGGGGGSAGGGSGCGATAKLQPIAEGLLADAHVDFVTIMRPDGTRVTHPDLGEIGRPYLGTIPGASEALSEEFVGTLGLSVRTIVPVRDGDRLVGWVSSGITIGNAVDELPSRLPLVIAVSLAVLGAGLLGAFVARRTMRRVAGDLPAASIRDAVSSAESLRMLSAAMRAQSHEHGNRMHTAVGLLEHGRTDDAIELLTESSRRRDLIAEIAAHSQIEPAVSALLLGKSAQAAERGIEWTVEVQPGTPRSVLTAVDAVSVTGNLIDNALDAAAAGDGPRWVDVSIGPGEGGGTTVIVVADSGDGVPLELRERIFEEGMSTKPADAAGRGVGLALVRAIVDAAGGAVVLDAGAPTTFTVVLPAREAGAGGADGGSGFGDAGGDRVGAGGPDPAAGTEDGGAR
ncbi:MAG: sensor histidine kinase [Pseudoclavibacter sp.]